MFSPGLRLTLLFILCLPGAYVAAIEWETYSELTDSDKADITALAQRFGIIGPSTATPFKPLFGRTELLLVRSEPRSDELRQSWRELYLCRKDDEDCSSRYTESEGNWVVAREFSREERWRFSDGDWSIDVELGTGISYSEADTIVQAILFEKVILAEDAPEYALNKFASNITAIYVSDVKAREFNVTFDDGGGTTTWIVRLTRRGVELFSVLITVY